MATGLLRAKKEAFVVFRDVAVDFTQEEWRLLSPAQKILHREVMLENYSHLVSLEIAFSKPKLITQLEQGEEPWREVRKHLPDLCPGSKSEIQPCPSCPLVLSSQQVLSQHVWLSHLPQLFSSLYAGNHLHPGNQYPEYQKKQQEQPFNQSCLTDKAKIQERKQDSKPLFGGTSKNDISKSSSIPSEEHPVKSKEGNTIVDIRPSLEQKADLEERDKVLHGLEVSGFEAIKFEEFGPDFIKESNLLSLQKTHTGEMPYMYTGWGPNFSSMLVLIKNPRTHPGEKPYVCRECGRGFTWKSNLITHQRTHSGEKPYVCKDCGQGFTWKSNLFTHSEHTQESSLLCKECGQSFSLKSNLITHQRAQTEEKPYVCKECGHGFRQHSYLIRHKRTHSREKPYVCRECEQSFSQKLHLLRHVRIHTGEKPYICAECGRHFSWKSNLKTHQRTHSGVRPYVCLECGRLSRFDSLIKSGPML
uniref:LOW QUALITY PROTEIN: zinc finger protein 875 n=1 Tax=Ictidomys tridecemlineatus TaxID=43179 RepID=UPI001A9D113A|nr:LOW QUALITY PROTEIN: zinc finger protein 875 [Ictidomys tridecemlineatus]